MCRLVHLTPLAALLCLGISTVEAQEGILLAFKFAPGDVISYEITISGTGSVTAAEGTLTRLSIQGGFTLTQTVTEVFPDGSGRLETRVPQGDVAIGLEDERVRFSYANGRIRWYANGKESSPPQGDLSEVPLIGTPLTCTVSPDGRVSDVAFTNPKLMAELAKAAPGVNLARSPSFAETLFPSKPVAVGETWRSSGTLTPLGPGLPITLTTSRTLESYQQLGGMGLAKVVGFSEARYRGPSSPLFSAQDVSIAVSGIRQTITSTEFFNTTSGRLIRAEYELVFTTEISAAAGGQQRGGSVEARLRVSVQGR